MQTDPFATQKKKKRHFKKKMSHSTPKKPSGKTSEKPLPGEPENSTPKRTPEKSPGKHPEDDENKNEKIINTSELVEHYKAATEKRANCIKKIAFSQHTYWNLHRLFFSLLASDSATEFYVGQTTRKNNFYLNLVDYIIDNLENKMKNQNVVDQLMDDDKLKCSVWFAPVANANQVEDALITMGKKFSDGIIKNVNRNWQISSESTDQNHYVYVIVIGQIPTLVDLKKDAYDLIQYLRNRNWPDKTNEKHTIDNAKHLLTSYGVAQTDRTPTEIKKFCKKNNSFIYELENGKTEEISMPDDFLKRIVLEKGTKSEIMKKEDNTTSERKTSKK